jgi:hypothetical protein
MCCKEIVEIFNDECFRNKYLNPVNGSQKLSEKDSFFIRKFKLKITKAGFRSKR